MNKLSISIIAIVIALTSLSLTIRFSISYVNNIGDDNIVNLLLAILFSLLFIIMSLYTLDLNSTDEDMINFINDDNDILP